MNSRITRVLGGAVAVVLCVSARAGLLATFSSAPTDTVVVGMPDNGQGTLTLSTTSRIYTFANVKLNDPPVATSLDVEGTYLPHILQAQKNDAGSNLNPEALKAIAVADRSLLYYSLVAKGWMGSGGTAPKYKASLDPQSAITGAVGATEREILQSGSDPIAGFSLGGTRPTSMSDARNTRKAGKISVQGADFLADHGFGYQDILRFYYGNDAQLTLGTQKYNHSLGYNLPAAGTKILADFENGEGILQSAKHADRSFTKTYHGDASELISIASGDKPFTYRALTGISGAEGQKTGNIALPADGELGFYLRTTTAGLKAKVSVNDIDGLENSATKTIKADGKWHRYSWNVASAKNWTGASGDVTGPFTLNSFYLTGSSDAAVRIDDVYFAEAPNNYVYSGGAYQGGGTLVVGNYGNYGSLIGSVGTFDLVGSGGIANLTTTTNISKAGAGTLILSGSNSYTGGALTINGSGLNTGTLHLTVGPPSFDSAFVGSHQFNQSGSINISSGSTTFPDVSVAPGMELSSVANGALLLSGGTFGDGGLLFLNTGSLTLSDASVAEQYANVGQSSGIVGTVLTPEPTMIGAIVLASPLLRRRRIAR